MPRFVFHLYITGQTPRSLHAAANLRRLCERHLAGNYELTLIDVQARPELAETANIFATPVTVRVAPPPQSRVIGDLADTVKVLLALGIESDNAAPSAAQG